MHTEDRPNIKTQLIIAALKAPHGNVFLRFCIVSSNELVVPDSLENKNARERFRVYVGPKKRVSQIINNSRSKFKN